MPHSPHPPPPASSSARPGRAGTVATAHRGQGWHHGHHTLGTGLPLLPPHVGVTAGTFFAAACRGHSWHHGHIWGTSVRGTANKHHTWPTARPAPRTHRSRLLRATASTRVVPQPPRGHMSPGMTGTAGTRWSRVGHGRASTARGGSRLPGDIAGTSACVGHGSLGAAHVWLRCPWGSWLRWHCHGDAKDRVPSHHPLRLGWDPWCPPYLSPLPVPPVTGCAATSAGSGGTA